ncbi:MAG: SGNH/GDSL hydrolase family protein [Jejuia sp.]
MKLFNFSFLVLLLYLGYSCKSEQPKPKLPLHNKKVLILGNSITQNGKYVDFLEYYLRKNYPKETLDIISIGLSSETVSGDSEKEHSFPRPCVHSRLDKALKLTKPDLVLACYGMNDGIYSNLDPNRFNNYKNGIQTLREKVQATGADFILMSPTPFDARQKKCSLDSTLYSYKQPYVGYNDVLRTYSKWLIRQKEVKVIDLHTALENELTLLKTQYLDSTFITDGVHPNTIGHFYMAKKILADIYPNISIGSPVSELEKLKNDSLFILSSKRRKIRSKGWLDYVGYIRKDTVQSDDIQPTIKKVKELDLVIAKIQNH